MLRKTFALMGIVLFCVGVVGFAQDEPATKEEVEALKAEIDDLEKRVMKNERKTALDRINFTGDYRFEAHSIDGHIPDHFDGMRLQRALVDTMFYFGATGMPPSSPEECCVCAAVPRHRQFLANPASPKKLRILTGIALRGSPRRALMAPLVNDGENARGASTWHRM